MATFRDFEKYEPLAERIHETDFGREFVITPEGEYLTRSEAQMTIPWAPESVYHDDEDDITIDGVPMRESPRWEALTGMTGQYGYNGAVMHSSEYIGAGIAAYLVELAEDAGTPQVFVLVVVEVHPEDDDPDGDYDPEDGDADLPEPAGWAILRYKGDE